MCKCENHVTYTCGCFAKRGYIKFCGYHKKCNVTGPIDPNGWLSMILQKRNGLTRTPRDVKSNNVLTGGGQGVMGFVE